MIPNSDVPDRNATQTRLFSEFSDSRRAPVPLVLLLSSWKPRSICRSARCTNSLFASVHPGCRSVAGRRWVPSASICSAAAKRRSSRGKWIRSTCSRQPSWRMSDLADALRIDPSTATRAVNRLVISGLAVRSAHDDDGRVVMVEITDAGRLRHAEVHARRGLLMTHMLGAFAPEERPILADMLERFVSAVDEFVGALAEIPEPSPAATL